MGIRIAGCAYQQLTLTTCDVCNKDTQKPEKYGGRVVYKSDTSPLYTIRQVNDGMEEWDKSVDVCSIKCALAWFQELQRDYPGLK